MTAETRTTSTEEGRVGEARPPGDDASAEQRADEIVEHVSATVVRFARRLIGRAREEVEDIVAEAQSLRRGDGPPE